jgi:hypothetical protein
MADDPTTVAVRRAASIDSEPIAAIYNEGTHGRLNGEWRDVLLVELLLGEAQPTSAGSMDRSAFRSLSSSTRTL